MHACNNHPGSTTYDGQGLPTDGWPHVHKTTERSEWSTNLIVKRVSMSSSSVIVDVQDKSYRYKSVATKIRQENSEIYADL